MKRYLSLLSLLSVVTFAGCDLNTGPVDSPTDPATETFAASLGVNISTMTETTAGDYYKDIKVGNGTVVDGDAEVAFNYIGYIKDGTAFETGSFTLADDPVETIGSLILGLEDGMQGMAVGGERLIVIPSDYGFGTTKITGPTGVTVQPNSTLIFDITLTGLAPTP